jgi:hypothetical protein
MVEYRGFEIHVPATNFYALPIVATPRGLHCRYNTNAQQKRQACKQAFKSGDTVTDNPMPDRLGI